MKLKLMGKNHSDELYTPDYALNEIERFLPKDKVILECAVGTGKLKQCLEDRGFKVVGTSDFFNYSLQDYDLIVSNPPYSIKDKFLEQCYLLNKPFALLMPITALEGIKRQKLYKKYGIQICFPKKRIDFNGKKAVWFYTAWFCWKLLPQNMIFNQELMEEK